MLRLRQSPPNRTLPPDLRASVRILTAAGLVLRAVRRSQKRRLDDLADCAGVGHVFVRDVEHGKPTVQLGRVLQALAELSIGVQLAVPDESVPELERLQHEGLRPLKRRCTNASADT